MRTVPAVAAAELNSRAFYARSWAGGWVIALDSSHVVIVDTALRVVGRVDGGSKPDDIALTSDGTVLVMADARTLSAHDVRGSRSRWSTRGNFTACRIVNGCLWAAQRRKDKVELSLHDPAKGKLLRSTLVADPFGESAVMLFAHPDERSIVVWVAAGQDGQIAYVASDDGKKIRTVEIPPRDRVPPVFLPDGTTYLSAGQESLDHLRCRTGEVIAALPWPATGDDDEDPAGGDVQLLPGRFASWSSNNGRLYLVDLDRMSIVDELAIAGHAVRTVEDLYPTLRGDTALCSDFEYAEPGPDGLILTVHARIQLVVSKVSDWLPDPLGSRNRS